MAGCSRKEDSPADVTVLPKEYTVSIGMSGEIESITDSPLTRADAATDLYGIQVYSTPETGGNYIDTGTGTDTDVTPDL